MKKNIFNLRKVFTGIALTGMMVAVSVPSIAKSNKKSTLAVAAAPAIQPALEYIGTDGNSGTVLHVNFTSEKAVKFELNVTDADGELLYSKEFEATKFSKYIKLVNEGNGATNGLVVTVRTLPNGATHSFNVATEDKVINEVSVNKL